MSVQQSDTKTHDLFCYDELTTQNSSVVQTQLQTESTLVPPVPEVAEETHESTETPPILLLETAVLPIRHSTRNSRPPIWHKDYVTRAAEVEPNSYAEATGDLRWEHAMQTELKALEDNKTSDVLKGERLSPLATRRGEARGLRLFQARRGEIKKASQGEG
ncbi:hypothetical protein KY290_033645 [Solanum tuberosum]|uniref:Integrase core domain containing protein n=1 Tax=Solanum tuberosum TaxID=4113 RepID=A0ABQ7U0X7_SOLTU|nr:hypothetical protein KY289_033017 [Solanum tuberosum]KAH0647658.1 hypothetical protein KY285_032906 [Solanum tuberosum]KAH0740602.1 hypothetical protein KY290_033645 [Solanum tuberosum]